MEYIYYPKNNTSKDYENIIHSPNNIVMNVICYHINNEGRYPFIQILLEYDINLDTFKLPQVNILSDNVLEKTVLTYMSKVFNTLNLSKEHIVIDGLITSTKTPVILVNITNTDISDLELNKDNPYWFALYNEIINNEHICNIPISDNVVDFCLSNPAFGTLCYTNNFGNKKEYPLPDVGYSNSDTNQSQINNIYGKPKNNGKYGYNFYFDVRPENINNYEYTNRYAIFVDKYITFTKEEINKYYNEQNKSIDDILNKYDSIYIQDTPTILILKEYNQHIPLARHKKIL